MPNLDYQYQFETVNNVPCASCRLKTTWKSLSERDPDDAVGDAEVLLGLATGRLERVFGSTYHGETS